MWFVTISELRINLGRSESFEEGMRRTIRSFLWNLDVYWGSSLGCFVLFEGSLRWDGGQILDSIVGEAIFVKKNLDLHADLYNIVVGSFETCQYAIGMNIWGLSLGLDGRRSESHTLVKRDIICLRKKRGDLGMRHLAQLNRVC